MVRIVHVASQLETGGLERLLAELARHVDRARFSLRFVSLGSGGRIADEIEALGWPVSVLDAKPGVRPALGHHLASRFREHEADIVHTHNIKPMLYAVPAAKMAGVGGIVHSRHGQGFGTSARQSALVWMIGCCVDRFVCVSNDAAARCRAQGARPESIRTIWNGIDLERFANAGPCKRGPAVFVGRLNPEKDLDTLLRATARVIAKRSDFRLQIAGSGPCEPDLKAAAARLGVAGSVEFLGEVSDVPALLARASMLVLPSITEGLPLSVLEAMASGLPVVATRVGGTPEAVVEGETGRLVPVGNDELLASGMLELHENPALARHLGRAGRERAVARFSIAKMVSSYEALYEEILAGRPAHAA